MWKADGFFTAIHFGGNLEQFALRFDPDETTATKPALEVHIIVHALQHTFRLTFPLGPSGPEQFLLFQETEPGAWQELGPYQSIRRNIIVELAIPWKALGLEQGQPVRLSIIVREHGLEVARYPHRHPATLTVPGPDFEAGLWRV